MQCKIRPSVRLCFSLPLALLVGCARPGPPKPPSLYIPTAVTDLAASRLGDTVELRFTAPRRASDGVPLRTGDLRGVFCRQLDAQSCVAVAGVDDRITAGSAPQAVTLQDALPAELTMGPPRLLGYRVEFFNAKGRSIGTSELAYSVAGAAPAPVTGFAASGARNGIVLSWSPGGFASDAVLLEREGLAPHAAAAPKPHTVSVPRRTAKHPVATPDHAASANVLWLQANTEGGGQTLDATVDAETPYRYRALRRRRVTLGGRTLEVRSALSAPVEITLQEVYPPAAPTGLAIAGYAERAGQGQPAFAADLVWQPVDDDSRTAALLGYNVYRETLDAQGAVIAARTRLNSAPALLPAFHDTTASPGARYRYSVTAIDTKGNESAAATGVLEPQPAS